MSRLVAPLVALVIAVGPALGGCSFLFVRRYAEPPPGVDEPDCTSSYRWPVVDTVIAVAGAAGAIYAVATRKDDGMPDTGRAALAGFGSLFAVGYGASAVWGTVHVRGCRFEKQRWH